MSDESQEESYGSWGPRHTPFVIGHEAAERTLLEAWGSGKLPHAWLITGPRGVGKMTMALRFARFLLAHGTAPDAEPGGGLFGPAPLPQNLDVEQVLATAMRDKKVQHGKLRFVLPTRMGHVELVGDIDAKDVRAALT